MSTKQLFCALAATSLLASLACTVGCHHQNTPFSFSDGHGSGNYQSIATDIEYPSVAEDHDPTIMGSNQPRTLENPQGQEPWNLTLQDAIRIGLTNSKVFRSLGGSIIQSPDMARTNIDPALAESDPTFGVEAALSAFDAQFDALIGWQRVDRAVNQDSGAFGGFLAATREEELGGFQAELSKTTAVGTQFVLGHHVTYAGTNNPARLFGSSWDVDYEFGLRHPFLQGSGVPFNRIAGPNGRPGYFDGVLIARIRTDITLADFEIGVRNLVSDIENAYWELYFAYRDLDAKITARDSALDIWRDVAERVAAGARGGRAQDEAQARSQYFQFQAAVENALSGMTTGLTTTGVTAGQFVGSGGVYAREANLRYLLGIAPNDGLLIVPADPPADANVVFNWEEVVQEALARRVELRRQKWMIKRRQLELIASRNFMMPRLDGIAKYRWRGFGDDLIDPTPRGGFDNAFEVLTGGDYQEWELGAQLTMPIGFRREAAGVRNAELRLARERAVLRDQELELVHHLDASVREVARAYQVIQTNYNRFVAANDDVVAWTRFEQEGGKAIDELLRAQQRLADADVSFHRSVMIYNLALKNIHFQKGSLLQYDGVLLSEGGWSAQAYRDARERSSYFSSKHFDFRMAKPSEVSRGPYMQRQIHQNSIPVLDEATELDETPLPQTGSSSIPGNLDPPMPRTEYSPMAALTQTPWPAGEVSEEPASPDLPAILPNLPANLPGRMPTAEVYDPPMPESYLTPTPQAQTQPVTQSYIPPMQNSYLSPAPATPIPAPKAEPVTQYFNPPMPMAGFAPIEQGRDPYLQETGYAPPTIDGPRPALLDPPMPGDI